MKRTVIRYYKLKVETGCIIFVTGKYGGHQAKINPTGKSFFNETRALLMKKNRKVNNKLQQLKKPQKPLFSDYVCTAVFWT